MSTNERALVLFSGGQDSATCLAWALHHFDHVETIGFDYGQRHAVELECRPRVLQRFRERFPIWHAKLGDDHLIEVSVLNTISETALTRDTEIEIGESGLPTTFIPGRNLLFLTLAAAIGYRRGTRHIIGGMCETDFSGYPDCRDNTTKAMQLSLSLGMDRDFVIHTPLMWIDKAKTWELAQSLGGEALVDLIVEETHSCYLGDRSQRRPWGYGCEQCPACELRSQGWWNFQASQMKAAS